MQLENQFESLRAVYERDVEESRRFLIGCCNGLWMSVLIFALAYVVARNFWGNHL